MRYGSMVLMAVPVLRQRRRNVRASRVVAPVALRNRPLHYHAEVPMRVRNGLATVGLECQIGVRISSTSALCASTRAGFSTPWSE